jgi:hypothetical protein
MEQVNANDVLKQYRAQVDELNFENTVLRLQVAELQKQQQPAETKPADSQEEVSKEDK